MFFFIVLSALTLNAAQPARHYVLSEDTLKLVAGQKNIKKSESGLHLVTLTEEQVLKLAETVHEEKGVCGGFVDIEHLAETKRLSPEKAFNTQLKFLKNNFSTKGISLVQNFSRSTTLYPNEVKSALSQVDKNRFQSHLSDLTAFNDRYSKGPGGVNAAKHVADKMKQIAGQHGNTKLTIRNIPTSGPYVMDTVVGTVEGEDPTLPGFVIGGHLDTFQTNKPGADDDGSGSATVMTVFEALIKSKMKFKRTMHFAFYAAEEYGLIGSQRMVMDFANKQIPVGAVLQFDMTAFNSPRENQSMFFVTDYTDPGLNDFLKLLATTYLGLNSNQLGETRCGYACSDHASWSQEGIPAAIPFEASFDNMNRNLHTSQDTMSILDMNHAFKFVELGIAFAVEFGEPVTPPQGGSAPKTPKAPNTTKLGSLGDFPVETKSLFSRGATSCGVAMQQTPPWVYGWLLLPFALIAMLRQYQIHRLSLSVGFVLSLMLCLAGFQNCSHKQ